MNRRTRIASLAAVLFFASAGAWAKIPPPPPMDPAAKEAAAAKKGAAAEKTKADLAAAEDRAVKNYQENMRKEGKPVPKPEPVAAMSKSPKGGKVKPEVNTKAAERKKKKG